MGVIEVPVQIRLADLLRAIERLSPAEFGVVASRAADLQRTQQARPDLLAQARCTLASAQQRRLESLAAKAEAEIISAAERTELLDLSAAAEQLDAERAEALSILAQQRGTSLAQLWDELNPDRRKVWGIRTFVGTKTPRTLKASRHQGGRPWLRCN